MEIAFRWDPIGDVKQFTRSQQLRRRGAVRPAAYRFLLHPRPSPIKGRITASGHD